MKYSRICLSTSTMIFGHLPVYKALCFQLNLCNWPNHLQQITPEEIRIPEKDGSKLMVWLGVHEPLPSPYIP